MIHLLLKISSRLLSVRGVFAVLLFIILHFTFNIEHCVCQWVQTNGPGGGTIQYIAASGTKIYAGTNFGLFYSSNNGQNWTSINNGITDQNIISVGISGIYLFAGTADSGIFRTSNNGQNWFKVNNGLSGNFLKIRSFHISGNYLFAGTVTGVIVSTNNGDNWSIINTGLEYKKVQTINSKENYLFAGTEINGMFRSTNNGINWTQINNGLSEYTSVISSAVFDNDIYIGTFSSGVYKSSNYGNDWIQINNGLIYSSINTLASSDTNLFAGSYNGVYLYSKSNNNWIVVNSGLEGQTVKTLASFNSNIYAGTYTGVYKSSNTVYNWIKSDYGLTAHRVYALLKSNSNIFAGTGFGVFISEDNGLNWNLTSLSRYITSLSISGTNLFAGTYTGGVFKTTNNGLNWTQIINGLSVQYIFSLTASGINLFAGTDQGLFLTTNYGNNWIARNTGISNKYVNSILIKDSNIFIATSEYASGGGVFLSTNNGINWTQAGLNEKAISSLTAIGNFLFAGTYEGVYRSSNNGNNWLAVNNGLTGLNVKKLISWGNLLIAGFDTYPFGGGVYATTNYGDSWINTNSGFYNIPSIYSCLITDNIILAGTYGQSVWRRPLSEIIGIKNISSEVPEGFELGQNYPNPFNANTIIRFQVSGGFLPSPRDGNDKVVLRVYDLMGREVRTLVDERLEAGVYEVRFDAGELPSGIYFYRMETEEFKETRKLVLLK